VLFLEYLYEVFCWSFTFCRLPNREVTLTDASWLLLYSRSVNSYTCCHRRWKGRCARSSSVASLDWRPDALVRSGLVTDLSYLV